jgi:hypothetical protein
VQGDQMPEVVGFPAPNTAAMGRPFPETHRTTGRTEDEVPALPLEQPVTEAGDNEVCYVVFIKYLIRLPSRSPTSLGSKRNATATISIDRGVYSVTLVTCGAVACREE